MEITRFAPSPTGRLHVGHVHSAFFAAERAAIAGGTFLLRIEDIDAGRCRPEFEAAILEDLSWLGLSWPQPVRRQSEHLEDYAEALRRLEDMDLLYPCVFTRRALSEALSAPHLVPEQGPEGPIIVDTDQLMPPAERDRRIANGEPYALRLRTARAVERVGPLPWYDRDAGWQEARPELFGDVVLARKDVRTSYHLAVTLDDALQDVSLVTRGNDLFTTTHVHRLLQALLDLPVPEWQHHRLIADDGGKRLSKRTGAVSVGALREAGHSAADVRAMAEVSWAPLSSI